MALLQVIAAGQEIAGWEVVAGPEEQVIADGQNELSQTPTPE
jgi:hypothetical protein